MPTATETFEGPGTACPNCGAAAERGQLVCLECGGRLALRYRRPPRWPLPAAIAGIVVLTALGALFAILAIASDEAEKEVASGPAARKEQRQAGTDARADPAAERRRAREEERRRAEERERTQQQDAARTGVVQSWPSGRDAFTVVLASTEDERSARALATQVDAAGVPAGILRSDDYSSLSPGFWIVFSGVHPTRERADAAAARLRRTYPGAFSQLVNGSETRGSQRAQ